MAYPLYSRLQQFVGELGESLPEGELRFFDLDTTTPKSVYADFALTDTNGAVLGLDSSGRMQENAFGSGNYYVELWSGGAVPTKQGEDLRYDPASGVPSLPTLEAGEFIGGPGYQAIDLSARLVPDPTGHANDVLGTDGDVPLWVERPADGQAPELPITVGADSFQAGAVGSDFYLQQRGEASLPGGGGRSVTHSVTFPVPYKTGTEPRIGIQLTGAPVTAGSVYPKHSITAISPTGFTVAFSTLAGGTSTDFAAGTLMTGTVNYEWIAHGVIADPT
jgi:hypothetical protein